MHKDRKYIIDQKQPFGFVKETPMMGGSPSDHGYSAKPLGDKQVISNHGFGNKVHEQNSAGAEAYACRGANNPFGWTDKPGN